MSNGASRKVHLGELANALNQIATWTQAVQAELLTYQANASSQASLDGIIQAVATAVDSTATAAARAKVADVALTTHSSSGQQKHDLATDLANATADVKTFVDRTITGSSLATSGTAQPVSATATTAAPVTGTVATATGMAGGAVLGRAC